MWSKGPKLESQLLLQRCSFPLLLKLSLKQLLYTENHIAFNVAEILNPFVYRLATAVVLAI